MVDVLKKYLANQQQISIKGIGTVSVEQLPARVDFPNQLLHPPETILHFSNSSQEDVIFCKWLSRELQVPEAVAVKHYQSFSEEMVEELAATKKVSWDGVGEFVKVENGLIRFNQALQNRSIAEPVPAKKIVRQGTAYNNKTGEEERTNAEIQETLSDDEKKIYQRWWMPAAVLLLISIIAVLIYFSSHAKQPAMHGNQNKPDITEMPVLYQIQ